MTNFEKVPFGNQEIIEHAIERAKETLASQEADVAVGFAEGVIMESRGLYTSVWCAIVQPSGEINLGGGLHTPLPENLLEKFREGTLTVNQVEAYLDEHFPDAYEMIVQFAAVSFRGKGFQ
jgi:non-canonical (house-cleaning) NTP pyrophosphatase